MPGDQETAVPVVDARGERHPVDVSAARPVTQGSWADAVAMATAMSSTAVVRASGVGDASLAAYTLPVTWVELENASVGSGVSESPVM